ncbi:MAG TPA: TIM44-like domain-containing protein [Solirubrobacteraceae bacterium]|nr:TIM44-like domain-containing protein [Solirubrobacteraceae bacterium]
MARFVTAFTLALTIVPAQALAGAGGGSSGYGGGGGGGGGGFGGGGGSTGTGSGDGPWWLWLVIVGVFGLVVLFGAISAARLRAKRQKRVRRTIAVSAEAAGDDAWFEATRVEKDAAELFRTTQKAWHDRDRKRLRKLVGDDLMVEWERRLDDFDKKGWHNIVEVKRGPAVEYVGLVNREEDEQDRVVVRLEAEMRDCVKQRGGAIMNKDGAKSQIVSVAEYWTLARRGDAWCVVSIEQDSEGAHHLDAPLVPSPWSDEQGLKDETALERAKADAPQGATTADLVDVDYLGDARKAALDLSLVDERFAPHVLEAAARTAMSAWAEAVDGDDARLRAIAGDEAVHALLYGGDAGARSRLVVRGPELLALRIAALDADTEPATLTVEADVSGRRYVEDRDTLELLSGSRDGEVTFTERWTLRLDGTGDSPWRIAAAAAVSG